MDLNIGLDNFSGLEPSVLLVVVIGLGTVFLGLICLIFLCFLLSIKQGGNHNKVEKQSPTVTVNQNELVKTISSMVAQQLGVSTDAIHIRSIRQLSSKAEGCPNSVVDKQAMVAAVSAAVAEELDVDVQHLRIHSIKPL